MNIIDVELHDARLVSVANAYALREVTISVEYYATADTSIRKPATISFVGVSQINEISDLAELESNRSAGNISYWIPAVGPGTTFIYLVRGLIAITASRVAFSSEV